MRVEVRPVDHVPRGLGGHFNRLWASTASSNLADGVLLAGLPVVASLLTDDPALVAGVMVAFVFPMALAALPSGVLTDRHDHRTVLIWANAVRAGGLLVALGLALNEPWRLFAVYLAAAIAGSTETLADATAEASVPSWVGPHLLRRAHARLGGTQSVLNDGVGAPIGGALGALGFGWALAVPAALFAAGAGLVRRLPARARTNGDLDRGDHTPPRTSAHRDIAQGLAALRADRLLLRMAWTSGLMNLANTAFFGVAVLLVSGPMGLPASTYGLILIAIAVGGLLGSLVAERVVALVGVRAVLRAAPVTTGLGYGLICVTVDPRVTVVALAVIGASGMMWGVSNRVLRQQRVPATLLGRVTSTIRLVALFAAPLGGVLGGMVGQLVGIRHVGWVTVAAGLAGAVLVWPLAPDDDTR